MTTITEYKVNENNNDVMVTYNNMNLCNPEFNCNCIKLPIGKYIFYWFSGWSEDKYTVVVTETELKIDTYTYPWDKDTWAYVDKSELPDIYSIRVSGRCHKDSEYSYSLIDEDKNIGVASFLTAKTA